jgi:hypothetical protein
VRVHRLLHAWQFKLPVQPECARWCQPEPECQVIADDVSLRDVMVGGAIGSVEGCIRAAWDNKETNYPAALIGAGIVARRGRCCIG